MTKAELLEKMKVKMLVFLEEQKQDYELAAGDPKADEYDRVMLKNVLEHIKAVRKTTIIDPIFEAMESWDVPSAIMFVVKNAVSDPENLDQDGADIPLHWDT